MTQTDEPARPHTVTAHIAVRGARRAADWYRDAFGAEVGRQIQVPGGKFMEIQLRFGDSTVMIADEFPEMGVLSPQSLGGTYGALHLATDDAEALYNRAVAAGAEVVQPLADVFWGDRHGQVLDPFGHRWGISQHLRDVAPDEIERAAAALFGDAG